MKPTDQGALTLSRRQREGLVKTQKKTGDRGALTLCEMAERDLSGHGKKSTDRGTLTSWRWQREALVRTQKEIDRSRRTHQLETVVGGTSQDTQRNRQRRTHFLEAAEGGTCQDKERIRPTKAHSHPGDDRGRDLSGHRKKQTGRSQLTSWRRQREGLVRTRKETDRPRRTYNLEGAEGGTCQDTQINRPPEAHSQPGSVRGRDLSGHGKKPTDRGTLTNWRWQKERLVRTRKQTDRLRRTHKLETAVGGTCQDTERNQPTEVDSHSGDGRGSDLSGHRKTLTDQGALTSWRRQRERLVRTRKETDQATGMGTHKLDNVEGRVSWHVETMCERRKRVVIGTNAWNVG